MARSHEPSPSSKVLKTRQHPFKTLSLLLLVVPFFSMKLCCGMSVLDLNFVKTSDLDAMVKRACARKISECPAVSAEEEMDSESSKRMLLMRRRYISYGTLKRDMVPCTNPGASYYNCRGAGPANTYNRGCEIITRCDRGN